MLTRFLIIACFISFAFVSCQKDDSNSQGSRLKMIRTTQGDSIAYVYFQYDDQNRLTSIADSNNNGWRRNFTINYDAQGKLWQVLEGGTVYTFQFDDKGRISKKIVKLSGQPGTITEDAYSYDVNDRVLADSLYNYWPQNVVNSVVIYSYDANGNVISSKTVDKSSGTVLVQEQCTYDTHPNPLDGKTVITYLLSRSYGELPAGKNNLLKETYNDGTIVSYKYEYYSNGLPKKCSYNDNYDPLVTSVEYFYE